MPTLEKQDDQDDEPNNQRQAGERYCEQSEKGTERQWIQQASEIEAESSALHRSGGRSYQTTDRIERFLCSFMS